MKTLIIIGGFYCLAFAIFHLAFWKIFDWKTELPKLNDTNRGVMQVLNLRLTYIFLVFAFVSFYFNSNLLTTDLGKIILGAISLFWLMRAIEQPIFWKFNDVTSVAFFLTFLFGAAIYFLPLVL